MFFNKKSIAEKEFFVLWENITILHLNEQLANYKKNQVC